MPRSIAFLKYYDKASTILAADQVSAALRQRGLVAHAIYPSDLHRHRDGIVVFIKTSKLHHLLLARRLGNRTILDVHDTIVFKRRLKNRRLFDGMIFRSSRALADFGRGSRPDTCILLHWDPRFEVHTSGNSELKLAYLGDRRSFALWDQVPGVDCIDNDYFQRAKHFNCHLSIRQSGREWLYKTTIKVSTAAACGAGLITTPDCATRDLLGEEYPFYVGNEPEAIRAGIDKARLAIGTALWDEALARLAEARLTTSLDALLPEYVDYLTAFS